ncbi:hypothetical protein LPJ57_003249 [Coemansia sp. RSA 486]|nr:hypothetical protein LPJ57_003249 [Coemansia sp. RSA 486]
MAAGILGRANVIGYYPNWVDMPKINFNKYTHVNFAFAIPKSDGSFVYDNQGAMPGGPQFSVASAIDAWRSAGWPESQMNLGIPFYGYALTALKDMSKSPSNMYVHISSTAPQGDKDDTPYADPCAGGPAVYSGQWQWKHLRDQGLLSTTVTAALPWIRSWDTKSSTPWLFNPVTKTFITYDDPQSIQLKVDYAASRGLAGTMVWSMDMDYNDELLSVLQNFSASNTTATETTAAPTLANSMTESTTAR